MPVVTFASTKGGSGKTTASLIFATRLFENGAKVILIEGDPNRAIDEWARKAGYPVIDAGLRDPDGVPPVRIDTADEAIEVIEERMGDSRLLVITTDGLEESLMEWIEAATAVAPFVICDPEGSGNMWLTEAMAQSDLVIVPVQPSTLDLTQAAKMFKLIEKNGKKVRRIIPSRILLTRTAVGAVATADENETRPMLEKTGTLMKVSLGDRPAFRAIFKRDTMLNDLADTRSVEQARLNAQAFSEEIISILGEIEANKSEAA